MSVDRCVCHDRRFDDLLRLARQRGLGLAELSRLTGCGTSCGMCLPYLRIVLATGRTSLPVLEAPPSDDAEAAGPA